MVRLARSLPVNFGVGKVSYVTEGSELQGAGIPTVICGPGSIEQAHRPNEFVALEQIARSEAFLHGPMSRLC